MVAELYIGVGSNVDPAHHVPRALELLMERLEVLACSTLYWSEPLERPQQAPFLNGVWRARSARPPRELKFELLRPVERELDRTRGEDRHAARTIDLDLLLYDDLVLDEPDLVLPDPEIPRRSFLWRPLLELDPTLEGRIGAPLEDLPADLRPDPELTRSLRGALDPPPSP